MGRIRPGQGADRGLARGGAGRCAPGRDLHTGLTQGRDRRSEPGDPRRAGVRYGELGARLHGAIPGDECRQRAPERGFRRPGSSRPFGGRHGGVAGEPHGRDRDGVRGGGRLTGYPTREVAEILGIPAERLRRWAREGYLDAGKAPDGTLRFSFPDIILLRAAEALREAGVSSVRIRRTLRSLAEQLPAGRPLSAVHIASRGEEVLVRDRDTVWVPETGQVALDFSVQELASKVEPFAARAVQAREADGALDADDWYDLGLDLEAVSPVEAERAYDRALALAAEHADAAVNRGRLRHERGDLDRAEADYRRAVGVRPDHALAHFNLGVVLEDRGRDAEAGDAYRAALGHDPQLADAHFNLAGLLERSGDVAGAVRHLAAYRRDRARA
ncbi:MAG: tetratricopeptide repeat protein [Gemmatimonadetes bacterium]|nr:tetratricopeptide repeat protein [Gemmatimonadota bacterium]